MQLEQDVTSEVGAAVTDAVEAAVPDTLLDAAQAFFDTPLGGLAGKALLIVVTLLVMLAAVRMVNRCFGRAVARMKEKSNSGATLLAFLRYFVLAGVYFTAFAVIVTNIPVLQDGMKTLFAAGGVLAVVLGFASQEVLGSVAAGVMILISKPFAIGDVVNVISEGVMGTVEDITMHHTVLRTMENKRIIVPNSTMSGAIVENFDYAERHVCLTMDVGITYESDLDRALKLLAEEVGRHPAYLDVRTAEQIAAHTPRVSVRVQELGDSAVVLRAFLWGADNAATIAMRADLLRLVKQRFDREGIDLAYPHLVVIQEQEEKTV